MPVSDPYQVVNQMLQAGGFSLQTLRPNQYSEIVNYVQANPYNIDLKMSTGSDGLLNVLSNCGSGVCAPINGNAGGAVSTANPSGRTDDGTACPAWMPSNLCASYSAMANNPIVQGALAGASGALGANPVTAPFHSSPLVGNLFQRVPVALLGVFLISIGLTFSLVDYNDVKKLTKTAIKLAV